MNYRILAKVLGLLLVLISLSMFVCGLFARLDVVAGPMTAIFKFANGLFRQSGLKRNMSRVAFAGKK